MLYIEAPQKLQSKRVCLVGGSVTKSCALYAAGTREQRGGGIGGAGEAATTTAIPVANVNRVWGGHDGYHIGAAKEAACTYFIKRKKRTCSNRAADGLTVCSLHTPVALQAERVRC